MNYFTQLYTPETFVAFSQTDRTITGVRPDQGSMADRLQVGDVLLCYMTVFSRWVGALRVAGRPFMDERPILFDGDPFTLRIPVETVCWLDRDQSVPIQDPSVWNRLSFTKDLPAGSTSWTGKVRRSLYSIEQADGAVLLSVIQDQFRRPGSNPIDAEEFNRSLKKKVQKETGSVLVSIPDEKEEVSVQHSEVVKGEESRLSHRIQASLARIGEATGHRIWIPQNDRGRVSTNWCPEDGTLLDALPLSYDEATIKTVEQIDVLWIRGRSIRRAFEVEHTTAIYSGLLRMADLLALQGNMQIALHIVAPGERRNAVLSQISRPVFSLLENAPLAERCSFLSYDSVEEIVGLRHLERMKDEILDDYAEFAS
jgi:hypothetical protein